MTMHQLWILVILAFPLLGLVILGALGLDRRKQRVGWIRVISGVAALGPLLGVLSLWRALSTDPVVAVSMACAPQSLLCFSLRVDALSLPFLLTEAAVTLLAVVYGWGYQHEDERTPFFYALLLAFSLGMAGTSLADDLFLFYVFWELMLVASAVLVVGWGEGERRNAIALKYFIFTHVGSLCALISMLLLYTQSGTTSISALVANPSAVSGIIVPAAILFFVGFCVKMAVFPLHLWLPDTHTAAPMSVTIILAAAMLGMGTYGMLRFPVSLLGVQGMAPFQITLSVLGIISQVYGALMALAEKDIKRIIAYSSVSQMGYILFGIGTLTANGVTGAIAHVAYHGIAKALLFMCIGIVVHGTGERRIDRLGGLGKALPWTMVFTGVGALTIAGTPLLAIFGSEWLIFSGGFEGEPIILAISAVIGSLFTVVYALWFFGSIFLGAEPKALAVERPGPFLLAPTAALAILAFVAGVLPGGVLRLAATGAALVLGGS